MVNHKDWRKRKELYEYYVDYDQIIQYQEHIPERCNEIYQYIESKKTLYEYFKDRCRSSDENICPKFYAQCKEYGPKEVLSTISCHDQIIQERSTAERSVLQREKEHSGSETDSEERDGRMLPHDAPRLSGKSDNVTKLGNVLLGVVATTMASGGLYRVIINPLIQINFISLLIYFITSP
ncbi:hypothetical protein PVIIG_06568 [Plasmodium vivax India VII]|uniref:Uncharacterized protein n=1 Tax=Plasmodium vivax India VII TaxID=1077284 RepID=A0A0J9S2N2_PLAVI|nr:hypothetical protein PVIIG_06568 [Plasmodium vivax India VII]